MRPPSQVQKHAWSCPSGHAAPTGVGGLTERLTSAQLPHAKQPPGRSLTPDCRRWAGGQPWSSIAGTCPGSDTCSAGAAAPVTSRRQPHPPANRRLLPAQPQIGFVSRACDRERLTQRTSLIIVHAPQQTPRAQFLTALNARRHPWHLTRLDAPYTSYLPAKSIGDSCLCQGRRPQIPTMSSRPPSRVVFVGNIPYGAPRSPAALLPEMLTYVQGCPRSKSQTSFRAPARSSVSASSTTPRRVVPKALASQTTPTPVRGAPAWRGDAFADTCTQTLPRLPSAT